MILTDTGPLVALLDKDDPNHVACVITANQLTSGPLVTTWPCFTEAMYLLGEVGGHRYQAELWKLQIKQRLILHPLSDAEVKHMAVLMEKYHDTPMDLADASIMAVAESRSFHCVFTVDSDFYIYRLTDGSTLKVIP